MKGWDLRLLLSRTLTEYEVRNYLGMSRIGKCPRTLYDELVHGRRPPSERSKRYCHEGYLHEHDIVERLARVGVPVMNRNRELVAPFDDRFRGHIDGEVEGDLLEVKSVNDEKFCRVMDAGALPEHMDQVQTYLRYGGYERALLVYKCRNTGEVAVVEVARDEKRGAELEAKARAILAAVDGKGELPACTCGFCARLPDANPQAGA
jgi:hypothetical protein